MILCCGMAVQRKEMLGMSVRKMKTLTVKMERATLSVKVDKIQHALCIKLLNYW